VGEETWEDGSPPSVAGTLHLQVVVRSWERTYGATVSTATTNSRRFVRAFGSPGDVLLAVGLAAFALAELSGLPGLPRGVTIPGATLMTIPLLWRRHLPVTVAATVSGAFAAQTLLGVPHNAQLASLVAVLVASYSVGSHAEKRRSLWGLAIIGTSAIVTVPANPGWAVSDFGFAGLVVVGAWLAGRLVRTRTVEARTHESRAAALAAASEERARQAIEAERRRIARELHDVVAHNLSLMVLQAGAAEQVVRTDPARALVPLRTIQETGRRALTDMKLLLGILRGSEPHEGLRPQPGIDDIGELIDHVRDSGLSVKMTTEGTPQPVTAGVGLSAYRVVQEALTNVMKHAPAADVSVCLRYSGDRLDIDVTNTGPVEAEAPGEESGLRGMRDRVELFGGELSAGPTAEGGFYVHAQLPVRTPASEHDSGSVV
jgi:signal transduction histidine kinase